MKRQTLALLAQLDAACQACNNLAADTVELLLQHPDAKIITSFPRLAALTGARVLAEIGDDHTRSTHAGNLKAHAGNAPVTRQPGMSRHVAHRRIKNNRLAATVNPAASHGKVHALYKSWGYEDIGQSQPAPTATEPSTSGKTTAGKPPDTSSPPATPASASASTAVRGRKHWPNSSRRSPPATAASPRRPHRAAWPPT